VKLSLQWKWFLGLAILLADLLLVVNVCIDLSLPPYLAQRIRADLQRDAVLGREVVSRVRPETVDALAHDLSHKTRLRVTILSTNGTVIGESDKPPEQLSQIENHINRPEIQAALRTGLGSAMRHSDTIGVDLMYVAVPVTNNPAIGFVRVALPLHEIELTTGRVRRTVAAASIAVALVALPIVFVLARRLSGPIDAMQQMATRVTHGDFSQRAPERGGTELRELGAALNQMSNQLESRLRELNSEKAELSAILASMTEGVLVVDATGRIRLANRTLCQQFQLGDEVIGKTVLEVFRHVGLEKLTGKRGAGELSFLQPGECAFAVTAAALESSEGTVVVFHDITRIKQLEIVRKDFVANVSHELRTPLSIIKGYVETLLDDQPPDAATAKQFLLTIEKHARRLEALIGDLLNISELESQQARLSLGPVSLRKVIEGALDELRQRAKEKSMTINVEIADGLPSVRADAQRLNQVLINLLDNAIKYTQAGGRVTVSAKDNDSEVQVCVADNGPGIAPEHLQRIFERFYRVDKARSREMGGTGLGLSIVKHIVQAHGGRVWAESALEKGSAFYFTLPRV
jgi:two-component system phosphate regulon sensor histidine kinase PhoR